MEALPRVRRVSDAELRELFNSLGYEALVEAGRLIVAVESERHPSSIKANEPICTRSQLLAYKDSNEKVVARAHRYLRPDGTIGASGRADPKFLLHEGVIYKQKPPEE